MTTKKLLNAKKLLNDCFLHDKDRLRHADAIALLKSRIAPVTKAEEVALADAAGRILAAPLIAQSPVPAHTNSAVDGYAYQADPNQPDTDLNLPVSGLSSAGHPLPTTPQPQTAVRIFTGAVMPEGFDTVVMQEDVAVELRDGKDIVTIPKGLNPGANVRKAGEDVTPGTMLFEPGHIVRPQDIAAMASIGAARLTCFKPLRVAVVSTGDEVVRAGDRALQLGEVYDTNAPMLKALANLTGAHVTDLGVWPDDLAHIKTHLAKAAQDYDVILTSGGASRGDEDHVLATLNDLGTCHMWQLAIKPGRPLMFGQIGDTVMVGLPGNPVAVFVCFLMYVFPMLRALSGAHWPEPQRLPVPAAFDVPKRKTGRREFWRAHLVETTDGLRVDKFARDGSGLISGLTAADGIIDIPEDTQHVSQGTNVPYIPLSQFGILGR